MLAQMAQDAREGFRRNAQLRSNRALALVQGHTQRARAVVVGVAQQPLGAARLGVLRQTADGQLGLLVRTPGQVAHQVLHRLGQGGHGAHQL